MHGIAYDELHDEIIVPVHLAGALLVFRGDAEGEDPPVRVIQGPLAGPKTGIVRIRQIAVYDGRIFVAVKNNKDSFDANAAAPSPWDPDVPGFIGVWNIGDNGNAPPRAWIKGPATGLIWPAGLALNS